MDRVISLGIGIMLLIIYKILEFFHIFRTLQLILAIGMLIAIYGVIFGFDLNASPKSKVDLDEEAWKAEQKAFEEAERIRKNKVYEAEIDRLNQMRRNSEISETDYNYWTNHYESKIRK